jgi:hypothetical protein
MIVDALPSPKTGKAIRSLNSTYTWLVGGVGYHLQFEFERGLSSFQAETGAIAPLYFSTNTKEAWSTLRSAVVERYGEPTRSEVYPPRLAASGDCITDEWRFTDRTVNLALVGGSDGVRIRLLVVDPEREASRREANKLAGQAAKESAIKAAAKGL